MRLLPLMFALACVPGKDGDPPAEAAQAPRELTPAEAAKLEPVGEPIHAVLTSAPNVPPPITRKDPAKVIVELTVIEKTKPIADGVDYTFWTFGGDVPGQFMRVRQGDTIEFHLQNHPDNKMPHNIDLHAVSGPGGGAASTFTAPGHESVFSFKALNPGLYVYHCATAPVGMHIANGMYGMILVEPPQGLPPVDKEYYVMEGDFYTVGKHGEKGLQAFDMEKAIDENPTYVLFNGMEGALVGDKALQAKKGDKVRIFFGVGGPNITSSFHVIGEIFDKVYTEGGSHMQENVQTTMVPSGGSAIVEFTADVPGTYVLVDHSIFRTFHKGALGMLKVTGDDDKALYSGKTEDRPFLAGREPAPTTPVTEKTQAEAMAAGEKIFSTTCATCHQPDAKGLPGVFPPLAGSDFLMADETRAIGIVSNGLNGKVVVNGQEFNSAMPPMSNLRDDEIADVLTYVRNSFGNKADQVTLAEVSEVRAKSVADAAKAGGH